MYGRSRPVRFFTASLRTQHVSMIDPGTAPLSSGICSPSYIPYDGKSTLCISCLRSGQSTIRKKVHILDLASPSQDCTYREEFPTWSMSATGSQLPTAGTTYSLLEPDHGLAACAPSTFRFLTLWPYAHLGFQVRIPESIIRRTTVLSFSDPRALSQHLPPNSTLSGELVPQSVC